MRPLTMFIVFLLSIAVVSAQNPGHSADDIGPGTMTGPVAVDDFEVTNTMTLGGVARTTWPSEGISGSGTPNYIPRFTNPDTIGDSVINQIGSNIGIGTTTANKKLEVAGGVKAVEFCIAGQIPECINSWTGLGGFWTRTGTNLHPTNIGDNVGIGTTNPNVGLHVKDSTTWGAVLWLDATGTEGGKTWMVQSSGGDANQGQGKFVLKQYQDSRDVMVLTSNGNVGIGTTTPQSTLEIANPDNSAGSPPTVGIVAPETSSLASANFGLDAHNGAGRLISDKSIYMFLDSDNNQDDAMFMIYADDHHSSSQARSLFTFLENGNVGIGTTSPGTQIHVAGSAMERTRLERTGVTAPGSYDFDIQPIMSGDNTDLQIIPGTKITGGSTTAAGIAFYTRDYAGVPILGLGIDRSGNVGIGTTSPGAKLDVAGKIHATGDICTDVNGVCLSTASAGGYWTLSGSNIYNNNAGGVNVNSIIPRTASWASYGTGDGGAAIYNDASGYNALMIVGADRGQGYGRWVRMWDSLWVNSRIDSKIYYDRDNTGYYVDPNSISNIYRMYVNDYIRSPIFYDSDTRYYVDPNSFSNTNQIRANNFMVDTSTSINDAALTINDLSRYIWTPYTGWGEYWDTYYNRISYYGSGALRSWLDLDDGSAYFSGNVGIGTSPSSSYKIYAAGGSYGIRADGSTAGGYFRDTDSSIYSRLAYSNYGIYSSGDAYFSGFAKASSIRLSISSSCGTCSSANDGELKICTNYPSSYAECPEGHRAKGLYICDASGAEWDCVVGLND